MTDHELFEGVDPFGEVASWHISYEDAPEGWLGGSSWPSLFLGQKQNDVYVYCELVFDREWPALVVELLSALPDVGRREGRMTWLEHELNVDSFAVILGLDHDRALEFALAKGLCPGQWFVLKLRPHYSQGWSGDHYEYDFEVDFEMISAQQLSPEVHAERWSEFWADMHEGPCANLLG